MTEKEKSEIVNLYSTQVLYRKHDDPLRKKIPSDEEIKQYQAEIKHFGDNPIVAAYKDIKNATNEINEVKNEYKEFAIVLDRKKISKETIGEITIHLNL